MTYGILCFGLFFSVLGTVLGGIWANESWGRFWGWDPKENGALMIVLWELAVLHARRGDYIRHLGFAMACIVGGIIVTFSWWGINLLGVGLHSYGFTSGIQASLLVFYTIESFVLLMGSLVWLRERVRRVPAREARL
jgi:cytochrome c biogenesis factor